MQLEQMDIGITYQQERGPAATPFHTYSDSVMTEFRRVLASDPLESVIQQYLERHPSLVPGAWTPGSRSSHPPHFNALISQPVLPGFGAKIPDFMWISGHSGGVYAALIEIERPSKRIFLNSGKPSSEFNQAKNQLTEWRVWFDSPSNQQVFFEHYGITEFLYSRVFNLHLILIFGRRSEFENNRKLSKHRGKILDGKNEELMSFDRLKPDSWLKNMITVKPRGNAEFDVLHVPEVFSTNPHDAIEYLSWNDFNNAVSGNPSISGDRQVFLKRRFAYWVDWAQNNNGARTFDGNTYDE